MKTNIEAQDSPPALPVVDLDKEIAARESEQRSTQFLNEQIAAPKPPRLLRDAVRHLAAVLI